MGQFDSIPSVYIARRNNYVYRESSRKMDCILLDAGSDSNKKHLLGNGCSITEYLQCQLKFLQCILPPCSLVVLLQMGWDLAVVLSALAIAEDGDIVTEKCSIGREDTAQTGVFGGIFGGKEG